MLGREARTEDLLHAVQAARAHAEQMLAIGAPLAHEYLAGRHPQQQEVHLRSLTFDYLYRWALFNRDWADRTEAELKRWRDTEPSATKHRRALERIRQAVSEAAPDSRAAGGPPAAAPSAASVGQSPLAVEV